MSTGIKEKKYRVWDILPYVWLGMGVLLMFFYHIGPGKALVDGDMAGEMILADLLNKEHDFLLSDNWYQATEIHVFFMQIIFRPLLLIWPNNWHIVRVVGMMIIYAINILGYLFMMKQTGIKRPAIWSAGALMWPMGMWRFFLGLYGGQYLVYDFFMFYILGLILYISNVISDTENTNDKTFIVFSKSLKVKIIIPALILAFLSFAGGVNGVRETMMLFMPVCLGVVIVVIRHLLAHKNAGNWKDILSSEKKLVILFLWIVFAMFCNLVGYAYNLTVLMKKYSFQKNTNMVWASSFSFGAVLESISEFFGLFGYTGDKKLFSSAGICSALGIVLMGVILFAVIRLFINRDKLSLEQELILSTFVSGLVACACIFGLMEEMNEPRYWTPFMCFAIMLLEIEWDVEEISIPNLKRIVAVLVSLAIIITSIGTIRNEMKSPFRGKAKFLSMASYLEENGYTQGYADFWVANPVTEFTSNRVTVRPIMYQESFEMMQWSNRIDYATTYPDGEVFFLIDKKSYPGDAKEGFAYKYGKGRVVLDDDNWLMLMFSDARELEIAFKDALENGDAIDQATRVANDM
ncbi:MAG: hypothetical protein K6A38_10190 [Lachnospiraceae bacterium]|nr:hypothetical protein [Lachnospiraceae bacterium]